MRRRGFGLISVWFIPGVLLAVGGCRKPIPVVPLRAVAEINWEDNLLLGEGVELVASSHNLENERVENLLDNDLRTFWQIEESKSGLMAWVEADFGEDSSVSVSALAARPRVGHTNQFFRNVQVQASDDGEKWKTIAWVRQDVPPDESVWYRGDFANREAFRFWRLLIPDGHLGPRKRFLSIADLALF